jgi:hypothetical protein
MRCARSWDCAARSACMQRSVALACLLTSCPRTRACSFTMPLSAHRAVRACQCHARRDDDSRYPKRKKLSLFFPPVKQASKEC